MWSNLNLVSPFGFLIFSDLTRYFFEFERFLRFWLFHWFGFWPIHFRTLRIFRIDRVISEFKRVYFIVLIFFRFKRVFSDLEYFIGLAEFFRIYLVSSDWPSFTPKFMAYRHRTCSLFDFNGFFSDFANFSDLPTFCKFCKFLLWQLLDFLNIFKKRLKTTLELDFWTKSQFSKISQKFISNSKFCRFFNFDEHVLWLVKHYFTFLHTIHFPYELLPPPPE